jgi:hypothetical protein
LLVALLCAVCIGCTSDGGGESSFRNLGKRGDSDLAAGREPA